MLLEETEGIRGARQEVGRNAALGGPGTRVQGGKGIIELVNTAFTGGLVVKNPLGMQEKQEKWV